VRDANIFNGGAYWTVRANTSPRRLMQRQYQPTGFALFIEGSVQSQLGSKPASRNVIEALPLCHRKQT
jgi:hypothetical protein